MKNTIIIILSMLLVLCACTKEPEYTPEVKEATPLVIETPEKEKAEEVIGVYKGTITITGEGVEDICYEGVLQITKDGSKVRVTANDAIRSNFVDLF